MKQIRIYTDGACSGNPGPGGWAAVLLYNGHRKEIAGGESETTNNRMELTAAIRALQELKQRCVVELYTDSEYLRLGITQWLARWKRNGWRRSDKEPVKNQDLWSQLDEAVSKHEVSWHWVRGHSGDLCNERCDELALAEIEKVRTAAAGPR